MAKKLILYGRVQGVCCRAYCSQYARTLRVRGSATNCPDGTVRVLLDTDDSGLVSRFIDHLKTNPDGYGFYGHIQEIEVSDYSGIITGDYRF